MFHGYGSYTGKYGYVAKVFADEGFDVVGLDYPGFGNSAGERGLVLEPDVLLPLCIEFVHKVKATLGKDKKIFAWGYSLGAAVSVAVKRTAENQEPGQFFDGFVLVVPHMGLFKEKLMTEEIEMAAKEQPNVEAYPGNKDDSLYLVEYFKDPL